MSLPSDDEPVHFEHHIKPLFREKDRQSMRLHFDLGSYEDVSDYADRILGRVQRGTMPVTARGHVSRLSYSSGGFADSR